MRTRLLALVLLLLQPACAPGSRESDIPTLMPETHTPESIAPGDVPIVDAGADATSRIDATGELPQTDDVLDAADGAPEIELADLLPELPQAEVIVPEFAGPCDFAPLAELPGEPVTPGEFPVGDFTVTIGPGAALKARGMDDPDRVLFATAPTADFVTVREADITVTEKQGSFRFDLTETLACTTPEWVESVHVSNRLVLRGIFDSGGDCAGRTVTWRFCQPMTGHLRFEVETDPAFQVVEVAVESTPDERIFGLGEQFPHDTLDLKGRVIPVLAQEGGVGRGHPVISPAVNAVSDGSAGDESTTYYAAPFFFTDRMRGLFLENTEVTEFDFSSAVQSRVRVHGARLVGRILAGATPLGILEGFTQYAGRMPPLPDWVHDGAVVALARPLDESAQIVQQLRSHGAEIAAVWNQTWSGVSTTFIGEQVLWNWVQNPNHHPGWHDFVETLAGEGIRTLCYVNPMFRDVPPEAEPVPRNLFEEGVAGGYFVMDEFGVPLLLPVTAFEVALLDLTNEEARTWMKEVLVGELVNNAGCSGWMADFAEALPFEAHLHDGSPAAAYHNRYPVEWARLNREAVEEAGLLGEALVFNRSGHTRTPTYSMLLWEGDQLTTWDRYDGFVSALHGLLNGGLSGIALNHSDTGGYTSLSQFGLGYKRETLLLKRWTEMNAFTAVLRTHEGNQPGANAQVYSDAEAMAHFARFTKVYKALAFYRKQLETDATTRGWPLVRHLLLHYPDSPEAWEVHDEFLLGSEVLVAPTLDKCPGWPFCNDERQVVLPPGSWVHLWSGTVYGTPDAWQTVTVQAPVGEPAVFTLQGGTVGAQFVQNLQAAGVL